jgi:transposase
VVGQGWLVPDSPSYEQLLGVVERLTRQVAELAARNAELERIVIGQAEEIAGLKRRLAQDSSNSSRPPSSDAPWSKQPAKKRSSRSRPGRNPGKQPGALSSSRRLIGDPDETTEIEPDRCRRCDASLEQADEHTRQRRQVVDVRPAPRPKIVEYQRISKRCRCRGAVTTPDWDTGDEYAEVIAAPGSPLRIGPHTLARAPLLSCAHYLPVGRSRKLLEALCGIDVSTGFLAGIRGRAARKLEKQFLPIYARYWPTPRYCTRMRPLAALPAPCPTSTLPAPST